MKTIKIIFSIVLLSTFINCEPTYKITKEEREMLKTYPHFHLKRYGKKELVKAYKLEQIDSIRNAQYLDQSQEFQEEMNQY